MSNAQIQRDLKKLADGAYRRNLQRFFKTGPGEYGEGDRFIGVRVPLIRKLARQYHDTPLDDIEALLESPIHEARMLALIMLVYRYPRSDRFGQEAIYRIYLKHTGHINNWDLVDCSAGKIVGAYLYRRDKGPLHQLARSSSLWERRIAIIATGYFIGKGQYRETLRLAERLLQDEEDLIHKAVGWMLREVGKRDRKIEEAFLRKHGAAMPRTMLRYAIEKFPEARRRAYLRDNAARAS